VPLKFLLILVIGGIAAIALALHLLGFSTAKKMDLKALRSEWLRHFPDDTFQNESSIDLLVTMAGDRGILRTDQGYGFVWTMGADTSARRLEHSSWEETPTGVTFTFRDAGAPRIKVRLHNSERHLWQSYLRKLHGS